MIYHMVDKIEVYRILMTGPEASFKMHGDINYDKEGSIRLIIENLNSVDI